MKYELATLSYRPLDAERIKDGIEGWVGRPDAAGELLGCWEAEHGGLFRLHVLRGFTDIEALREERERALRSGDPFGGQGLLTDLDMVSYAPFPFLPPVATGRYGSVYEIRTYVLVPGGLPPTLAGWAAAVPERTKLSPLTIAMHTLDGPVRITQIWPYASMDARLAVRKDAAARGLWPPVGGPENILKATSVIALPTRFSPLA